MVKELMNKVVHGGLLYSNLIKEMDANVIFQNLLDHSSTKRVEILIVMRKLIKTSNGHLPFRNATKSAIFEVLHHVLEDFRWEVKYQCLLLIAAIIPFCEDELDSCMLPVMPRAISNLGHENSNVRRAALQVLHIYMKYTNNLQHFQKMFIMYGLESSEYVTRKGCIISIGILFTSEFANENLCPLIESLSKHFVHGDASLFYPIFLAMQKISELVGPVTFETYLQRLDQEAVNTYKRVQSKFYSNDSRLSTSSGSQSSFSSGTNEHVYNNKTVKYIFGIFDSHIIDKINSADWKVRIEGIEHMKVILKESTNLCEELIDMDEFMVFLARLLDDSNFKIVILALSIYDILIDKFRKEMKRFLKTFVNSVSRRLGDTKLVVREHAIKVIHKMMHHVKPADVLDNLLEYKAHRNPRLREEIVNRVTAAVLTFPSYSLNFSFLCEAIAPLLVDAKRRVRLAALECFAVLAQTMGPARLIPLVSAVDLIEINSESEGLLGAVQARLARRVLPKCTEDGSVTYAITLPSSAGYQNRTVAFSGADIDWIMAASGSSSSSTPPSRGKDSVRRERSAVPEVNKVVKSSSDSLINVKRIENANWVLSEEENSAAVMRESDMNYDLTTEGSSGEASVSSRIREQVAESKNLKGSSNSSCVFYRSHLQNGMENLKFRQNVGGSKIPILTSNLTRKRSSAEETSFLKTGGARASSGGVKVPNNTVSQHNARYSANHKKNVIHNAFKDESLPLCEPRHVENETVLRKVSPGHTSSGNKPILVRSPSLNHLQHLPFHDYGNGSIASYEKFPPPYKPMGNITSHFRPSPGGVVVAQPAPIHLDNDISIIEVGDYIKVPSSPSPQSWPSPELYQMNSRISNNNNNKERHSPTSSLPDVYEIHKNPHYSAPAGITQDMITSPLNGMDSSNISISKITREKMLKRQQEILREAEEKRMARERSQQEQNVETHLAEVQQELLSSPDNERLHGETTVSEDDEYSNSRSVGKVSSSPSKAESPSPKLARSVHNRINSSQKKRVDTAGRKESSKPLSRSSSLKTPSTLRKLGQLSQSSSRNFSHLSKHNLAASSLALFGDTQENLSEYPNPDEALKKALKSLSTETWMGKIEGIHSISRLAQIHPDVLLSHLHPVVLAVLTEVKNLRSSVSRAAILAIGDLFTALKRNMELDLELITSTLLNKSGEIVGFIRDDIEKVMKILIESVTPNKAALAIMAGGASHRNGAVRKTAAQSLFAIVEKMGAARVLTSTKEVTEKLLPVTAQFLMDGTPLTRYYGRKICQLLMTHPSFDKLLVKYVQPSTLRNVNSILESVRKKGAGEMPRDGISTKSFKTNTHRGLLNRTL